MSQPDAETETGRGALGQDEPARPGGCPPGKETSSGQLQAIPVFVPRDPYRPLELGQAAVDFYKPGFCEPRLRRGGER